MIPHLPITGERFIPGMLGMIELEHIHRYALAMSLAQGKDVLDIASGEGYGSKLLSSVAREVVGIDICPETVAYATASYATDNLSFQICDCADIPFESASFDLVVSFETIEHHDRHDEMLAEIARVLKPNGFLIISSPNKSVYSDLPGSHNPFHVKELYLDEFESLLQRYFPNVQLYGQRASPTSVVVPLNPVDAVFSQFMEADSGIGYSASMEMPVYYIAVAGRSFAQPNLGVSTYENCQLADHPVRGAINASVFETKMYWRAEGAAKYNDYSEDRSNAILYSASVVSQLVRLVFPESCGPVTRIRLDFLNALGGIVVRRMSIVDEDERAIWQWCGGAALFQCAEQAAVIPDHPSNGACMLLSFGNDPWFELGLDDAIYEQIKPGCALLLEISPFQLFDCLPSVLEGLLNRDVSSQALAVHHPVQFADNLGSLATLVSQALARRDEVIREQLSQLGQMRDELTRAEAQLDLLKDLMLAGREEDRL